MSHSERIPVVLYLLEKYWQQHPDSTLGHIISSCAYDDDLYYLEDFSVACRLQELLRDDI